MRALFSPEILEAGAVKELNRLRSADVADLPLIEL